MFKVFVALVLSVLLCSALASVKEFNKKLFDAHSALLGNKKASASAHNLRVQETGMPFEGSTPGEWVVNTAFNGGCTGTPLQGTAYRTGACYAIMDEEDNLVAYGKHDCFTDTGSVQASFYEDDQCTQMSIDNPPMVMNANQCLGDLTLSCESNDKFFRDWRNQMSQIVFGSAEDASSNNVRNAKVIFTFDQLHHVRNLRPTQRSSCNMDLIPGNCVDTSAFRSYSYAPKSFTEINLNLYPRKDGSGAASVSTFSAPPNSPIVNEDVLAVRVMVRGWYDDYFLGQAEGGEASPP